MIVNEKQSKCNVKDKKYKKYIKIDWKSGNIFDKFLILGTKTTKNEIIAMLKVFNHQINTHQTHC